MPDSKTSSRPASVSTTSSLMQDVPGAFPAGPQSRPEDDEDEEQPEVTHQSLSQVVYARRAEYVKPRRVRIKVGSWNVAAFKGTEKDVGGWFVGGRGVAERLTGLNIDDPGEREEVAEQENRYERGQSTIPIGDSGNLPKDDEVGLYFLGLQEVVDVNSATEALRPYTDPSAANKWKEAMQAALPEGYQLVTEQQLIGLLLLVYAAPDVAKDVKSVSTTSVGTGLMGYMGNKGAVTARIVLGETTRLVFINCHLAAGADKAALERRNWDAQQIVSRTRFEPIQDAMDLAQTTGEQIGDEDFAFWCGDLNYRLEGIPGDDVRRLLMLHTRNEYDLSQRSAQKVEKELQRAKDSANGRVDGDSAPPSARSSADIRRSAEKRHSRTLADDIYASEDPTSLQTTLSSLLPHDELHQQMQSRKAFHDGWQEGPITFLPTYKYDPGSVGVFDSSEKKRAPSWCDRILWRTRRDKVTYEKTIREEQDAKKKDAEWKANGTDLAASDEEILYDYDPDMDGADANDDYNEYDEYDDAEDGVVITKEGFEDEIQLEYYTAHQRVLSSDHKPLDASFVLKYDAVIPELKAKVHAEVARELDKAENEGRPNVTVVVDSHNDTLASADDRPAEKFEGVWFGDVRWAQSKHRSLTVANTSRVEATFSFIERPVAGEQTPGIAPKWLTIKINDTALPNDKPHSESVTLEPGESCNVELELRIMGTTDVQKLNDGKGSLEDILVLRVDNGRDHFIPVRGRWLDSSLGRSIDKLVRIPEGGIRKLQRQKPKAKTKAVTSAVSAANELSKSAGSAEESTNKSSLSLPNDEDADENPVRFSAPRELFRLTEAVEELSTRVVAEWEMMYAPVPTTPTTPRASSEELTAPSAPWNDHPGWPFDEECWTECSTSVWTEALSEACNALDEDTALESATPAEMPRIQRLYVLCSLLVLFLRSMPDGIISVHIWPEIEKYAIDIEKMKNKPTNDEQRTSIQETLVTVGEGWNSISFILVMSMLERMLQERYSSTPDLSTTGGHVRSNSKESTALNPLSPTKRAGGTLKRIVTGKGNTTTLQQLDSAGRKDKTIKAWARVFGEAMIRTPDAGDKAKAAAAKRREGVVEVFLKRD
ncbi:hypothetical protein M409DRAFT_29651 [Zasmidium cellare ATCC 36951]|uniref:Inositol polyphosphate-related phosphatase domain-containing protein n=1 Tax=Zasmidium cellare ATCC 36951 TaxID=1080233 RepID=A0A6A6BYH9_ZASCE|nr:uncharacterized protein M409DRAFT_29651 [Zasmidium cellare ATCC 36951]KAF2159841.1 hypothetical protein M409DRAFT_29651 [Zasmidium cellare ATCC 36951]